MRNIKLINDDWLFTKKSDLAVDVIPTDVEKIELPFTWNGDDGQDGGNDYYRGKCLFYKELTKDDLPQGDVIYIQLDGVNSSSEIYFNGEKITEHHGGYSTFRAKLNNIKDDNILVVTADNSPNDFVYPQVADFTFYGGIYRDVKLIGVNKNHFDLDYFGAPGIQVTPIIDGKNAKIELQAYVDGEGEVEFTVTDGENIFEASGNKAEITIENVHLWNGVKDPFLYVASAKLIVDGEIVDEISTKFGCRSYEIDANEGFILNGEKYALRGVSRHQDRPHIGNALKYEHHKEDIDLICEVSANTIRLAHYQHSQDFYDLCDEKGLVVWAEIPYISRHMATARDNTISQMTELIAQNYNHPSIVVWGLSNEITMNGAGDSDLIENHKILNDLCHKLDKTRPTTLAVVTMCGDDEEYVHLTDVVSYNHYFGWYGGNVNMYGKWFDDFHKKYPNRAIGLSEYGCEALNWHTSEIEQGDYTEEYQAFYHEEMIKQIIDRPYLWATHVWNMFDFAADARAEGGESGQNHKGLVTFDRKYKKDSFYAYKAWLSDEPFVHICSKRYVDRVDEVAKITVYSNQNSVELFANGESVAKQEKGKYPFFYFEVKNVSETELKAVSDDCVDTAIIKKVDEVNQDYIMKDDNCVINWFEIDTPAGYFSINDTIGSIWDTTKGKIAIIKIALSLVKGMKNKDSSDTQEQKEKKTKEKGKKKSKGIEVMGFKLNSTMLDLVKGFSIKRVCMMASGIFTKEQILDANKTLNKIKKPQK